VGFLQMAVRWWDRWLKDIPNGAEDDPALRAFVMESAPPDACAAERAGAWVAEAVWPSARVSGRRLFLRAAEAGVSHPRTPAGYLGKEDGGAFAVTVATPQQLGLQAGEFFPMGLNAEMPGDQAADDALSVCFDGEVLAEPLMLLGQARLALRLASDRPLGFVVARLCDVAPDGSSVRIAHGMLNLCHRDGMEHPAPMVPGQTVDVTVTLDMAGYRVAAGHRLRVALSNSYWPFVWPSPEAGRLVLSGGMLDLPVHDGTAPGWTPPPVEHAAPWAHRVLRPARAVRRIEHDLIGGTVALVVETDEGATEDAAHGLIIDEAMTERWEIRPDDPLSARAVHVWDQRRARGDWEIRTRAEAEMTATRTHLRMRARLVAWEGGEEVFRRDWDEEVERRFV
jgi:predicted acyl esterase